jgi:hypothetical protein
MRRSEQRERGEEQSVKSEKWALHFSPPALVCISAWLTRNLEVELIFISIDLSPRSLAPSAEHHIAPPTITNPVSNKIPTVTKPCFRNSPSEKPVFTPTEFVGKASCMTKNKHHDLQIS